MNQPTEDVLRTAEEAVNHLVEVCRKDGPLYKRDPLAVAQTSRTSKWLLNAITGLRKVLNASDNKESGDEGKKRGA